MKKAVKTPTSQILLNGITYIVNGNNSQLAQFLKQEQRSFCAYTERQILPLDLAEIDHFNPQLKGQPGDNYQNWFLILAKWNRKKSNKWNNFQPILHPASADFFDRIWFEDGIFQYEKNDVEAKNLIDLLDLNNYELTRERNRYLERLLDLQGIIGEVGLRDHLLKYPEQYHFASAFETIFSYGIVFN